MSNPTSNFGWQMPTPTDLVTDLPADFEVFGQAVDTSLADLKGGTTGQILSKATNTDMDFVWITNDQGDITAVNVTSPITGGGTSGAVTVGIQSASTSQSGAVQLSDSTSTTSSTLAATSTAVKAAYDPAFTNNFYAGKNKIINGNFGVWQRGTSIAIANTAFSADRWTYYTDEGGIAGTFSQQTFTPGTAPVSGYEGTYFHRYNVTTAAITGSQSFNYQKIEDVRTFAGQTVTISFWAKADASRNLVVGYSQNFGTGGSASVSNASVSTAALTTSWQRFTATVALPSIAGATIGTGSSLHIRFYYPIKTLETIDIWGVQVEAGSTATPFQTASGSIQGELALCQRYYWRSTSTSGNNQLYALGFANGTTGISGVLPLPVQMRVVPTSLGYSNVRVTDENTNFAVSALVANNRTTVNSVYLSATVTGATQFRPYLIVGNDTAGYLDVSAEL